MPLALTFMRNQMPDLIVMDDETPCSSFYKIRSKKSEMPILLMTENCTDHEAIDKCLSLGAAGVIKDIYDKEEIMGLVRRNI